MLVTGGGGVGSWYTRYESIPRYEKNQVKDDEQVLLPKSTTKKSERSLIVKVCNNILNKKNHNNNFKTNSYFKIHPSKSQRFLVTNMSVEEGIKINLDGCKTNSSHLKQQIGFMFRTL